jgi:diguanylate cyclase (GGDEF)-like protein
MVGIQAIHWCQFAMPLQTVASQPQSRDWCAHAQLSRSSIQLRAVNDIESIQFGVSKGEVQMAKNISAVNQAYLPDHRLGPSAYQPALERSTKGSWLEGRLQYDLELRIRELIELAFSDPLTGILNRRAILEVAQSELRRHSRFHRPLSLGYIDLDHLREINRLYHHPAGDHALTSVAHILSATIRQIDAVGRCGGDEFLVVATEADARKVGALCERIRAAVANHHSTWNGKKQELTVSIGFACADKPAAIKLEDLMHAAAAALADAKTSRNCWRIVSVPEQ